MLAKDGRPKTIFSVNDASKAYKVRWELLILVTLSDIWVD